MPICGLTDLFGLWDLCEHTKSIIWFKIVYNTKQWKRKLLHITSIRRNLIIIRLSERWWSRLLCATGLAILQFRLSTEHLFCILSSSLHINAKLSKLTLAKLDRPSNQNYLKRQATKDIVLFSMAYPTIKFQENSSTTVH